MGFEPIFKKSTLTDLREVKWPLVPTPYSSITLVKWLISYLVELDVPVGRDLGLGVVLGRGFGNLVGGPRSKLGEKPLGSVVELI